jgi:hypothetical protein
MMLVLHKSQGEETRNRKAISFLLWVQAELRVEKVLGAKGQGEKGHEEKKRRWFGSRESHARGLWEAPQGDCSQAE